MKKVGPGTGRLASRGSGKEPLTLLPVGPNPRLSFGACRTLYMGLRSQLHNRRDSVSPRNRFGSIRDRTWNPLSAGYRSTTDKEKNRTAETGWTSRKQHLRREMSQRLNLATEARNSVEFQWQNFSERTASSLSGIAANYPRVSLRKGGTTDSREPNLGSPTVLFNAICSGARLRGSVLESWTPVGATAARSERFGARGNPPVLPLLNFLAHLRIAQHGEEQRASGNVTGEGWQEKNRAPRAQKSLGQQATCRVPRQSRRPRAWTRPARSNK